MNSASRTRITSPGLRRREERGSAIAEAGSCVLTFESVARRDARTHIGGGGGRRPWGLFFHPGLFPPLRAPAGRRGRVAGGRLGGGAFPPRHCPVPPALPSLIASTECPLAAPARRSPGADG